MGLQINQYTKIRTNLSLVGADLMDLDSTDNGGVNYQSAKMTISDFLTFINGSITNLYNANGTLLSNRTVTAGIPSVLGFWTKWVGGDVVVQMSDEFLDYAFLVMDVSSTEKGRLGYDQAVNSALFQLTDSSGVFFEATNSKITTNNGTVYTALNGGSTINLRDGGNSYFSITTDAGAWAESVAYMTPLEASFGFDYQGVTIANGLKATSSGLSLYSKGTEIVRSISTATGVSLQFNTSGSSTYANVDNTVILGGISSLARTDNTAYLTQIGYTSPNIGNPQTIVNFLAPQVDRTISFPDATGTVALTSDIAGLSETVTFGGGLTGDIASLTFLNGLVTSKTLVP